MKIETKLALTALAAACLLTGCPYSVKEVVGQGQLIKGYETQDIIPLADIKSVSDSGDEPNELELCEGASITFEQKTFDIFNPVRTTTLTGPGVWYERHGWVKSGKTPDCDDSDDNDDEDRDDRDDDQDRDDERDDERDQQEEEQQEQERQDTDGTEQDGTNDTRTNSSRGDSTGGGNNGGTTGGAGGTGNTILGVGTTTATVGGGLIAAVIIANELDNDDDGPLSE